MVCLFLLDTTLHCIDSLRTFIHHIHFFVLVLFADIDKVEIIL